MKNREAAEPLGDLNGCFSQNGGGELLELRGDALEFAVQVGTNRIDSRDNNNRNTGSDQAVFNRGRPRLILQKRNNFRHLSPPYWSISGTTIRLDH
jgi:hypothetical protein